MEITRHEIRTAGRVAHNPNMKQAVTSWLQTLDTNFFYAGIQTLVPWWDKRLNVNGAHMEV
jgi:hypothetical protein